MSDQDAVEAIAAVLEQYFRGALNPYEALNQIARIKGSTEAQQ